MGAQSIAPRVQFTVLVVLKSGERRIIQRSWTDFKNLHKAMTRSGGSRFRRWRTGEPSPPPLPRPPPDEAMTRSPVELQAWLDHVIVQEQTWEGEVLVFLGVQEANAVTPEASPARRADASLQSAQKVLQLSAQTTEVSPTTYTHIHSI